MKRKYYFSVDNTPNVHGGDVYPSAATQPLTINEAIRIGYLIVHQFFANNRPRKKMKYSVSAYTDIHRTERVFVVNADNTNGYNADNLRCNILDPALFL
jgi:hypothetical protein